MSLVRWGQDDSSVYVFNHVNGRIACVCPYSLEPYFLCGTDSQMAEHLRGHKRDGLRVPDWVFEALSGERKMGFYKNQP